MESYYPQPPFDHQSQNWPGLDEEMRPQPLFKGADYRPAEKLRGKMALITGGDSGIGRAVVYHFAREGAQVAFTHLPAEKRDADSLVKEVEALGEKCLSLQGDLGEEEFCHRAVDETFHQFGSLDVVVNNAAIMWRGGEMAEFNAEILEKHYRVNVLSYYYVTQAALDHMTSGSAIIYTGSITGSRGGGTAVYSGTKGAIHALTKSAARELMPRGIRVNCVSPGPTWTPLQAAYRTKEEMVNYGHKNPIERPAQPQELAPAYVFLADQAQSSYITGEIIFVTGGDVAR